MKFSTDIFLKALNELLLLCGIATLVALLWKVLELIVLKEVMPNDVDTIIATILTWSLYGNYKLLGGRNK